VLIEGQIRRKGHSEYSYMIAGGHSVWAKRQGKSASRLPNIVMLCLEPVAAKQPGFGGIHLQTICCHPVADVGNAMTTTKMVEDANSWH